MRFLPFLALAFLLGLAPPLRAQEAEAHTEIEPEARASLQRAVDFLRAQQRFAFSADITYEVLQDDGAVLEFGELRRYTLRRPDRLRVEAERRSGGPRVTYFDGTRMTVSSPNQKAYAFVKLKQPRTIDEAIEIMRDRLGMPVPLGELLVSNPVEGLDDVFDAAFLVGEERLAGVDCDHLALRNEDNEIEVWIARSDPAYVQRVHITYVSLEGQPRFSARLFDWSLSPDTSDAVFTFVPPPDAERVRFALGGSGTPATAPEEKKP
jgi:hypothetical protein